MGLQKMLMSSITVSTYEGLLDSPERGRLADRAGYGLTFTAMGDGIYLPWKTSDPKHWSRMWSNYLAAPRAMKTTDWRQCWSLLIPFEIIPASAPTGPAGTRASIRKLLYPHAVATIAEIPEFRSW